MSLDSFKIFKDYIKKCVLEDQDLQKLIYYPYSNCLERDDLENPFDLFTEDTVFKDGKGVHGVLLFKRQCDVIMNAEMPLLLISFETSTQSNSKEFQTVYILCKIICKGTNIQELNDLSSRIYSIAQELDNNLIDARINGLGTLKKSSMNELSINSENDAMLCIYQCSSFLKSTTNTKNYKKHLHSNW